jgi:hypothetical protein
MENKGLCSTCVHDADCAFPREFPIWECEEFSDNEPIAKKAARSTHDKLGQSR